MPELAFATSAALPGLTRGDRLAADALQARGAAVSPAVWDDPSVAWSRFDAVVIRSTWDYYRRPEAFAAWVERLEAARVRLLNPPDVVRWNMHKRYLLELERRGVAVIPTALLPRGQPARLDELLAARRWQDAVVKPAVSAGAWQTWLLTAPGSSADQARLDALLAEGDALVQPLCAALLTQGEHSFVFLRGAFSHAAVKRPRAGDFRVQAELGGSIAPFEPPPGLIAQARWVVQAAGGRPLYARVDGVLVGGKLVLMELELIEPDLYLEHAPGAAERLAAALLAELRP